MGWSGLLGIRPISRKNHLVIEYFYDRKAGRRRPRLVPSEAYRRFRDEAVILLAPGKPPEPLSGPLWLDLDIRVKGALPMDLDNAQSAVFDVLTEAQVIEDDKHIVHVNADMSRGHKAWEVRMALYPAIAKEEAA